MVLQIVEDISLSIANRNGIAGINQELGDTPTGFLPSKAFLVFIVSFFTHRFIRPIFWPDPSHLVNQPYYFASIAVSHQSRMHHKPRWTTLFLQPVTKWNMRQGYTCTILNCQ